eukprot:7355764-Ditylum_brightwellii.AAC.1
MATNYACHTICKQAINLLYCMCGKLNKTIPHLTSGCDILHGTKYTEHHDKVCTYLHWYILQDNGIPVITNWKQHNPDSSLFVGDKQTIMHNMKQQIDQPITSNCPNLIILDEDKKTTLLIDVTCPMDANMIKAGAKSTINT